MHWDIVVSRELDGSQHEYLRARVRGRHLEHLFVGDDVELARLRHEPRVGGEDARDVGVDLARGAQSRRECDGGRVGPTATERRHVHRVP